MVVVVVCSVVVVVCSVVVVVVVVCAVVVVVCSMVVVVVVVCSMMASMAVLQLSMSARTAVGFTQPPAFSRPAPVLPSSFSSHAANMPGLKTSFA